MSPADYEAIIGRLSAEVDRLNTQAVQLRMDLYAERQHKRFRGVAYELGMGQLLADGYCEEVE